MVNIQQTSITGLQGMNICDVATVTSQSSIPMYYLYEHMNPMLLRTTHVINNQNRPETLRMSPILINIYVKKKGVFHLPKTLSGKCMASFQSW